MQPITAYIHFPWCLKKCPYCDFVSFAKQRDAIDHALYANAVLSELNPHRPLLAQRTLRSVFFGGGTPSLWEPSQLGRVLSAIVDAAGDLSPTLEITVECNPTSLDEARARAFKDVGVNRLSVGVQGLADERLRFLGRLHDPHGALCALQAALASGIDRVSGDLIFGVATGTMASPNEHSPAEAASEALALAQTGVGHVSAYGLTIEPATQFGELARRGKLPLAQEDTVADSFFAIEQALESQGFVHYEISNYAKPGQEAQHNLGYWTGIDYLGLGCAAFGTITESHNGVAVRYRNCTNPDRYMVEALKGGIVKESEESLDRETRLRERLMLGLRLREGLQLEQAAVELGVEAWNSQRQRAADRLVKAGRLCIEDGQVWIPRKAWMVADATIAELF